MGTTARLGPSVTTRFGNPLVTSWQSWFILSILMFAIASFSLQGLSVIPGYGWAGILRFGYALLFVYSLIIGAVKNANKRRLDEADGLLCLRCGRPMVDEGEFVRCLRCRDSLRADFVRKQWSWKSPNETVTVSLREHRRAASRSIVPGLIFAAIAAAMLPLINYWGSSAICVIAIPAVVSATCFWARVDSRRTLEKHERRECLNCGYSLAGHKEWRCPECGQRVEWTDQDLKHPEGLRPIPGVIAMELSFLLAVIAALVFLHFVTATFVGYALTAHSANLLGTLDQVMIPGAIQKMLELHVPPSDLIIHAPLFRTLVMEMLVSAERGPAWIIASGVFALAAYALYVCYGDRVRQARERFARDVQSTEQLIG